MARLSSPFQNFQGFCRFGSARVREQNPNAALMGCCVSFSARTFKMGMLDEVIAAALRSRGQARQGQVDQGQRAPDQSSQIAAALAALLSARQSPGAMGQTAAAPAGQQNTANGLDLLINRFKQNGLEGVINSWIGTGSNQTISPPQLRQVLGPEEVRDLSQQTGASQDDLLSQLSKYLPSVIDKLTPSGRLPSETDLRSSYRRG